MTMDKNLVSIIIPTYNCAKYIKETVDSCVNQTYKNIEILVIDDGSTDNTKEILEGYINEGNIRYIYQENSERSVARNNGLDNANGDFIQFLDSDDLLDIKKIERDITVLKKNDNIFATYTGTTFFKNSLDNVILKKQNKLKKNIEKQLVSGNIFPIQSILFKKNNIRFDENYSALEDYDFWIRVLKDKKVETITEFLSYVRLHEDNSSKNCEKMYISEIKILEKYFINNMKYEKEILYQKAKLAYNYSFLNEYKKYKKELLKLNVLMYLKLFFYEKIKKTLFKNKKRIYV